MHMCSRKMYYLERFSGLPFADLFHYFESVHIQFWPPLRQEIANLERQNSKAAISMRPWPVLLFTPLIHTQNSTIARKYCILFLGNCFVSELERKQSRRTSHLANLIDLFVFGMCASIQITNQKCNNQSYE